MKKNFVKKWLAIVFLSFALSAVFAFIGAFGSFIAGILISIISNDAHKTEDNNIFLKKILWALFSIGGLFFAQMILLKGFEITLYITFLVAYLGGWLLYGSKNK